MKLLLTSILFATAITLQAQTVKIGKQKWMAENLNVDKFRNGEPIPEAKTQEEWLNASTKQQPVWCYYDFRAVQSDPTNGDKYGKLYNLYAVSDPRGLCPSGWHVPSDDEWTMLTNALGGEKFAGDKIKSTTGWKIYYNGTNSSGFNGLPGGFYCSQVNPNTGEDDMVFSGIGDVAYWWSSTESSEYFGGVKGVFEGGYAKGAWFRSIGVREMRDNSSDENAVYRGPGSTFGLGFSVRCVKD